MKSCARTLMFVLITTFSLNAVCANINYLDVGDGVYVQGVFSDELVYIKRIDSGSNMVKVVRPTDGTTSWVNASNIISREQSDRNDVGRAAISTVIFICLLAPEQCQGQE